MRKRLDAVRNPFVQLLRRRLGKKVPWILARNSLRPDRLTAFLLPVRILRSKKRTTARIIHGPCALSQSA